MQSPHIRLLLFINKKKSVMVLVETSQVLWITIQHGRGVYDIVLFIHQIVTNVSVCQLCVKSYLLSDNEV